MQSTSCTLHENLMKCEMWLFFVPISVWLSSVLFKSQFTTIDSLFFVCNSNFLWIYLVSFLFEMILLVKKNYIYKINSQFVLVWWMFLNLVMCWQSNLVGTQRAEWAFLVVAFQMCKLPTDLNIKWMPWRMQAFYYSPAGTLVPLCDWFFSAVANCPVT